jgi:hypothetical protein
MEHNSPKEVERACAYKSTMEHATMNIYACGLKGAPEHRVEKRVSNDLHNDLHITCK